MPADMHYKHELGWQCENFRSLRLLLGLGSFIGLLLVCGCLLLCGCLLGFLLAVELVEAGFSAAGLSSANVAKLKLMAITAANSRVNSFFI